MKRLLFYLFVFTLFASPLFAEELPFLWLEAGKATEVQWAHISPAQDWSLRFEHRTLDSGKLLNLPHAATAGQRSLTVKTPPVKPGVCVQAQLYFADQPVANIVIASPDPFEDRKEWCENHRIALYDLGMRRDPLGFPNSSSVASLLNREEISYTALTSFADIEHCTNTVILVTGELNFEMNRGLSDVLYEKAAAGHSVLIVGPDGDLPLNFHPAIHSLKLLDHRRDILPNCPSGSWGRGAAWTLQVKQGQAVLTPEVVYPTNVPGPAKISAVGPKILDVIFSFYELSSDYVVGRPVPKGRLYIDRDPIFQYWNTCVETRYYFKSIIETLTLQCNSSGRAVTP